MADPRFDSLDPCSNFSPNLWNPVITELPDYAPLAVEHCYYVLFVSGADGIRLLADLIRSLKVRNYVEPRLREIAAIDQHSQKWVERLRKMMDAS